jgi:Tfp pilus assembly protein PilN
MRAVNLLPEENRAGRVPTLLTTTSVLAGGAVLLTALLVFVGVSFVQSHGKASDRRDTLAQIERQSDALKVAQAKSAAQQGSTQARLAAFTSASGARMTWDDLLDDISRVLPDGSWLTSLNAQAGTTAPAVAGSTPATSTAPTAFTVSGVAFTPEIVAQVMDRLELVPALSDVTLQSSSQTSAGSSQAYQFTMSANVLPPEVPQ